MKLDKVVWVTGAGSKKGVGYAICKELTNKGYEAIGFDVRFDEDAKGNLLDITNESKVSMFFRESIRPPMAIVNCAGVNVTGEFVNYDVKDLEKTLRVNVIGHFLFSREFVRKTMNYESPKYIINIGSDSANTPRTNSFAYCSSKAALQMITKCLARDLAGKGYRTIEIDPSLILDTNMDSYINETAARLQGKSVDDIVNDRLSRVPLKRFAIPSEIAVWIPFILENGEYANGACIRITGGVI